jgi:hypothetical protein
MFRNSMRLANSLRRLHRLDGMIACEYAQKLHDLRPYRLGEVKHALNHYRPNALAIRSADRIPHGTAL